MKWTDLQYYDYFLPKEHIANFPVSPRDSSKLLVYNRNSKEITHSKFSNLSFFLPKKTVLVFNNSKVIRARIEAKKITGGKLELMFLRQKAQFIYEVLLSRKIKPEDELTLKGGIKARVVSQKDKFYEVRVSKSWSQLIKYLNKYGQMPLPPYIKNNSKQSVLSRQYQTVFSKASGSVAAPTASLHFTKRLLGKLKRHKFKMLFLTLHVGAGTFLPLEKDQFISKKLHTEWYEIAKSDWLQLLEFKKQGYKIIAVGTTSVRTLETIYKTGKLTSSTNLFISPGYKFKIVTGLITNFHLPKSSLLLLVASFIENRKQTLALYKEALNENYRFYSFGDGNLIL